MTRFSEYLNTIIEKSGMTESQLSKLSGFTRSYIALMRNGKRLSSDEQKMIKLMQALNLSPLEQEYFRKEYFRAKIGDSTYKQDTAILDFINSFNNKTNIINIDSSLLNYEIPNLKTINNKINLKQILQMVIEKESAKEDGYIHMIMQGGDQFLEMLLSKVCSRNKNLKIDHIVCLENNMINAPENNQVYNINLLSELVTTVVMGNNYNYQVYYYYDHVTSRFNTANLLSYMVLTSEYLICMDSDLNYGTISVDVEVRELYEQLFQQHKRKCQKLFLYLTDEMAFIDKQITNERKETTTYSLSQQPCIGMHKTEWLIDKYFLDNNSTSAVIYKERIRYNRENLKKNEQKHVAFCSKEGLNRLAKYGVVDEIPRHLYNALSLEDRKTTLKILLQSIDEGDYELYLTDDIIQNIPKELFISTYDLSNTVILYFAPENNMRFVLNEPNIIQIITNTLKNLPKYLPNDAKEQSREYLEYLENLINQL